MQFITRNLESDPGMSQKEALVSLQNRPDHVPGTIIASIRRRNDRWVAELLEPKTAGEPPFADKGDDSGDDSAPAPGKEDAAIEDELAGDAPSDDEGPSDDESSDGPPAPGEKPDKLGDEKPKGKGGTEEAILHVLTEILHSLQGGDLGGGMGGPDALGPGPGGPPSPPPPKGGPAGPPPPGGKAPAPKPMKPGMTPPGGTPVGAPAFASSKQSTPGVAPAVGTPVPSGPAGPVGAGATAGGNCPQCGYPEPCPMHGGAAAGGLAGQVASYSKSAATITLHKDGDSISEAVAEARPIVEAHGYQVKQAKRGDGQVHILATRR